MPFRLTTTECLAPADRPGRTYVVTFPCRDSAETAKDLLYSACTQPIDISIAEVPDTLNGREVPEHTVDFLRNLHSTYSNSACSVIVRPKVPIIKWLRSEYGCDLAEAKHWADANIFKE